MLGSDHARLGTDHRDPARSSDRSNPGRGDLKRIGRTYGRGQVHIHPATRTYDIAHQDVLAQFDHYERATNLESTGDALSLYGQRLSRGWAYWQPRLAARGWHTFTCDGSHEAISPHRRTSLLIDKDRLDVQIDSDHYSGPFSTRCFIAAP